MYSNDMNSYIQDLSPSCAAGLILAVSRRYAVFLRDFLSRYMTNRVYFGVTMVWSTFPRSSRNDIRLKV